MAQPDEPGLAEMEARFRGASLSSSASSSSSSLNRLAHHGGKKIGKRDVPQARRPPSESAGSRGSSVASDVQICFDFTKNMCARGDSCRYSHDIATIVNVNSQERGICFDFVRGQCSRGLLCRFSHDLSNLSQHQQAPVGNAAKGAPKTGAICYDFVKGACSRGSGCRYSHDINSIASNFRAAPSRNEVCYDHTRGRCTRGAACRYSHEPAAAAGGMGFVCGPASDVYQANAQAALQLETFRNPQSLSLDGMSFPSSSARLAQGMLMAVPPPRPPPPPTAERPLGAVEDQHHVTANSHIDVRGGSLASGPHNVLGDAWQHQQQQLRRISDLMAGPGSSNSPAEAMARVGYDSGFLSVALTGGLLGMHSAQPSTGYGPHASQSANAIPEGSVFVPHSSGSTRSGGNLGSILSNSSAGLGGHVTHSLPSSQIAALNSHLPHQPTAVGQPTRSSFHSVYPQPPPPPPAPGPQRHIEHQAPGWPDNAEVSAQPQRKVVGSSSSGQTVGDYGVDLPQEAGATDQTPLPPATPPRGSSALELPEDSAPAPGWESRSDSNNGMSQSTLGQLREIWSRSG